MAVHSSILAWRIPGTEEPGGLQAIGSLQTGLKWLNMNALNMFMFMLCSWLNMNIIKGWNTELGFVEHFPSADPRSSCPSQTKKREHMKVQRVSSPLQMLQQVWQTWGLLHNGHLLSEFWSLEFWHQVFPLNPGTIQAVLPSPSYIQAQNLTVLPPTDVFCNAHSCLFVCPSVGPGVFGSSYSDSTSSIPRE